MNGKQITKLYRIKYLEERWESLEKTQKLLEVYLRMGKSLGVDVKYTIEVKTEIIEDYNPNPPKPIDPSVCPKCGDDDETFENDGYDHETGFAVRHCGACNTAYIVEYERVLTAVTIVK